MTKKVNDISAQMKDLKDKTTTTLKKEGKYSPLYGLQVEMVSLLMAKIRLLMKEMERPEYNAIELEMSREGYDRKKINPCETLLQDYASLVLRALKGLGMNTDSKERKTEGDGFSDFMQQFKD